MHDIRVRNFQRLELILNAAHIDKELIPSSVETIAFLVSCSPKLDESGLDLLVTVCWKLKVLRFCHVVVICSVEDVDVDSPRTDGFEDRPLAVGSVKSENAYVSVMLAQVRDSPLQSGKLSEEAIFMLSKLFVVS